MKEITAVRENQQTQQIQQHSEARITDIKQSQRDLKIIQYKHALVERNKMHDSQKENILKEHDTRGGTMEI